jgi:hypothetical protein
MRREWSPEDLIESWTFVGQDWTLVGNKTGATRLGFALMLKFFEIEACFPRAADDFPAAAVGYVAEQVNIAPAAFAAYSWSGRSITYHRSQIRDAFGFREFTRGDEDKLAGWLAEEVCPVELRDQQLHEAVLVRCRAERIEPPGRVDRIIGSARAVLEQRFCDRTLARLNPASVAALEALVAEDAGAPSSGRVLLAELKTDPGQVGLETLLREVDKLAAKRLGDARHGPGQGGARHDEGGIGHGEAVGELGLSARLRVEREQFERLGGRDRPSRYPGSIATGAAQQRTTEAELRPFRKRAQSDRIGVPRVDGRKCLRIDQAHPVGRSPPRHAPQREGPRPADTSWGSPAR